MPIQLTTAFNPGSFDPGETYHQVAIEEFVWREASLDLVCYHGNTVSGVWTRGAKSERHEFRLLDPDHAALKALAPAIRSGDDSMPEEFYQWLIDKGHFAGTIL